MTEWTLSKNRIPLRSKFGIVKSGIWLIDVYYIIAYGEKIIEYWSVYIGFGFTWDIQ